MATLSVLPTLLVSSHILYHVFDDALHCTRVLESLSTESHLQPHHITPTLQLFPLHPDLVDLGDLGPISNDLGPQGAITHSAKSITDVYGRWEVRVQHSHGLVGEGFDLLRPIIGCRVQLTPIVRAVGGESSYHVRVTGHVDLDISGGRWMPKSVGDGEEYRLVPLIDLKVLRDKDRRWLPALLSACGVVARWSRSSVARLSSNSCLTSSMSSSYRHPLGRVGRRYRVGIFVVLLYG